MIGFPQGAGFQVAHHSCCVQVRRRRPDRRRGSGGERRARYRGGIRRGIRWQLVPDETGARSLDRRASRSTGVSRSSRYRDRFARARVRAQLVVRVSMARHHRRRGVLRCSLGHVGALGGARGLLRSWPQGDAAEAERPKQVDFDKAIALLKPMLEDPAILKVGQNIKYDALVLRKPRHPGWPGRRHDAAVLRALNAGMHGHGHGRADAQTPSRPHQHQIFKSVAGTGKKQVTFAEVPLDKPRSTMPPRTPTSPAAAAWKILKPRIAGRRAAWRRSMRPWSGL